MTEITHHVGPKMTSSVELSSTQENLARVDAFQRQRSASRRSMSSASSTSDSSEDAEPSGEEKAEDGNDQESSKELDIRKIFRSMSEGRTGKTLNQDIFPSLPNSFLDMLGLHGKGTRESLSEKEMEQKFITLALAFTIDAATIKDRWDRQRRYRDQTEENFVSEINRLNEKVTQIQPLCRTDPETAELLAGVLAQVDVVVKAYSHAAISAERFGAVQHEERLAEAVSLMINHVNLLKQQRDCTREQLKYTKKVLQDTSSSEATNVRPRLSVPLNGRIIMKRRASIATVAQPQDNKASGAPADTRRIVRRISDLSTRASAFTRSSRPSRLELGVDLDKIKEGIAENGTVLQGQFQPGDESDQESVDSTVITINSSNLSLRERIWQSYKNLCSICQDRYERNAEGSMIHEYFYFGSLLCFALAIVILLNVLVELEYSKFEENVFNKVINT